LLRAAAARVPRHPFEPAALPLSARAFLERWAAPSLPTIAEARTALLRMADAPNHVHWWRRALPGTVAGAQVVLTLLLGLASIPALERLAASRQEFDARRPAADEAAGGLPRREQSVQPSGVIISTVTAGVLALVLVCLIVSSLVVPGGIASRQLGLATVTRTGKEITRAHSLARVLVAGIPAIAWLTYLAFSPKVWGFVPAPPNPIDATLVTVGALGVGLAWTVVRRTRGPHDVLTGTWVVPR
jgi:hypothetical protein